MYWIRSQLLCGWWVNIYEKKKKMMEKRYGEKKNDEHDTVNSL
jgi:hypothetical protein